MGGRKDIEMECPICKGELYTAYPDPTFTSCRQCKERFTIEERQYKIGGHWKEIGDHKWEWVDKKILRIMVREYPKEEVNE